MSKSQNDLAVLVVDDETFIRDLVDRLLRSLGFSNITQARDGRGAIEKLRSGPADLIISDINMAPMNGLELVQAVRSGGAETPRNTPIMLLTGVAESEAVGFAFALDVDAFLTKPLERGKFEAILERTLATPLEEKSIAEYQAVALPSEFRLAGPDLPALQQVLELSDSEPETAPVRLLLKDVKPGCRLAGDLLSAQGTLFLASGDLLTERVIAKLHDLESVCRIDELWVTDGGQT